MSAAGLEKKFKSVEGAIFDMDGVVVDNHRYHFKAWMEFATKYKFKLNEEIYRDQFNGKVNAELFEMMFGKISKEEVEAFTKEKESLYQELYSPEMKPLTGLEDFLQALERQKIKIALGTSAPTGNVDFVLDRLKLRRYFPIIVDGTMVTKGKPNPEVYQLCAGKLGLKPESCVVFEDSIAGLESGRGAGCEIVAVATSHRPGELRFMTDDIITDFEEALRALR